MAPSGFGAADKPKANWICKICTKKVGRDWRINGSQNHCRTCNTQKVDAYGGNVVPSTPSVSRVHPPRAGGSNNAAQSADARDKQIKELKKQLTGSKKAAAAVEPVVVIDEDMGEGDDDGFEFSIEALREMVQSATKDGKDPKTHPKIIQWSAEIQQQLAAKRAAKPASQQLRLAEQGIQKLERQYAKM